jgi:hypothetical protein
MALFYREKPLLREHYHVETLDQLWNQVFFPLRQILLDQYLRIGLEGGGQDPLTPDHQYRTVEEGTSWEGGTSIQLPYIPLDSTIANNYRQYQNSAGIEMDSVRNPPRPAKQSRIQSYSNSLFGEASELSESLEDIKLP